MYKFLIAAVILFVTGLSLVHPYQGNAFPGSGKRYPIPVAGYRGPCDVVTCTGPWYGFRGASASAAASGTTKAVQLQRDSDSALQDIVVLTTGDIDESTITSFCAGATCFIQIVYDQSGTNLCSSAPCNLIASFGQAIKQDNCNGSGHTCSQGGAAYTSTNTLTLTTPWTAYVVCERTGNLTSYSVCLGSDQGFLFLGLNNTADTAVFYDGSGVTKAASDNTCHVLLGLETATGTNTILAVDNSETTGTQAALNFSGHVQMLAANATFGTTLGLWLEQGLWATGLSSGDRTALQANAHTYWSC